MNACPSLGEIIKYHDQMMPPGQMTTMKEHIDHCGACREQLGFLDFVAEHYGEVITALPQAGEGHLTPMDLTAYIDRALQPEERGRLELHLASCTDCLHQLITLKKVTKAMTLNPIRPPDELVQEVIALGKKPISAVAKEPKKRLDRLPEAVTKWVQMKIRPFLIGPSVLQPALAVVFIAVIALALLFTWQNLGQRGRSDIAMRPSVQPREFGFTEKGEILYTGKIRITQDLQDSILKYLKNNKTAQDRQRIVSLIRQQDTQFPSKEILEVVVSPDLLEKMKARQISSDLFAVHVYENGELEIVK